MRSSPSHRAGVVDAKWAWTGSNPGNLDGFKTEWMKQRLDDDQVPRCDDDDAPLRDSVPGDPGGGHDDEQHRPGDDPERADQKMTVKAAADDAASKIQALLDDR